MRWTRVSEIFAPGAIAGPPKITSTTGLKGLESRAVNLIIKKTNYFFTIPSNIIVFRKNICSSYAYAQRDIRVWPTVATSLSHGRVYMTISRGYALQILRGAEL